MFLDIGDTIERFVEEHKVGTNAWRRTGVLSFDGNTRLENKATYEKSSSTFEALTSTSFPMALLSNSVFHEISKDDQKRDMQGSRVDMPGKGSI